MATPNCDVCETVPADVILGLVATGDQAFLCVGCLAPFVATLTGPAAAEDQPATPAAEAPDSPQEAAGDPWEANYPQPAQEAPRGRKRGQNGKASEATETATAAADHE